MARPWTRTLAVVAALFLACTASARAAEITVNATGDAVDSTPDNGLCESTLGCTLRAAVQTAEGASNPGADVIHVGVGTYDVTGGMPTISQALTIAGAGARTTIIHGDGTARLFTALMSNHGDPLSFSDLTITGGGGTEDGGGVRSTYTQLTATRVAVVGNKTTSEEGGGIYLGTGSTASISDSLLGGNHVSQAGGGLAGASGAPVTLTNVTVSGNVAEGTPTGGGGLFLQGDSTLTNVTVSNNTADIGGGVFFDTQTAHTYILKNTIVAGNHSASNQECGFFPPVDPLPTVSAGHNISGNDTCNFHDPTDKAAADPQLLPLANNGGPTDTMGLAGTSPAIDAGDPAACPALDQRGVARLGTCDIGAFEYYPPLKGPPPTPDTRKPKVKLAKLKAESIAKALFIYVTPDETSTVSVAGSVSVPKLAKVYKLRGSKKVVAAGKRGKLTLKLPGRAKAAIKRALARHKKLKAKVTVTAKDAAGNRTVTRRTIRLKR
jgi:CSLREA domain-containing protein